MTALRGSSTRFPVLAGLADALRANGSEQDWPALHGVTERWVADRPDLLAALREQLRALPEWAMTEIAAASRETTTHFAWQLVGEEADARFSFWLHEYKPQRDWWQGYANSVHNHRYHFSSTVLAGGFQHEWYEVSLDPTGELVRGLECSATEMWRPGRTWPMTADRFHRVARAIDGTVTFLVKSRAVRGWSLSVDPATWVSRRHVPVEGRIGELADRI